LDCSYSIQDPLCSGFSLPIVPRISDRFQYPPHSPFPVSQPVAGTAAATWYALREVSVLQFFPQILFPPSPCTTDRRIAPTELTFKPFGPPADHYMQQIGQLANRSPKALLPITLRSIRVCFVIRRFYQRPIMLNCNVPFLSGFQPPTPQAYLSPLPRAPKKTISNSISNSIYYSD
jgi:hypothetical protein